MVVSWNYWKDLYSWTKYWVKDLAYEKITNPFVDLWLTLIEELWLQYIVWWYNNEEIAIINHWARYFYFGEKRVATSCLYWHWKANWFEVKKFFASWVKMSFHTLFSWENFYNYLCFIKETSEIILEKDIKKWMRWLPAWWEKSPPLTRAERIYVKQAKWYAKSYVWLADKFPNLTELEQEIYDWYDNKWIDLFRATKLVTSLEKDYHLTMLQLSKIAKQNTTKWLVGYINIINNFNY